MVVEITTFRLKPDVDIHAFVEADARLQEALMLGVPGFVRRTIARGIDDDREWVSVALWDSVAAAVTAAGVAESDASIALAAFVEGDVSRRFQALDQ